MTAAAVLTAIGVGFAIYKGRGSKVLEAAENGADSLAKKGQEAVTVISHECGLGSNSYFGKVFREYTHCSPTEYRRKWQNSDR